MMRSDGPCPEPQPSWSAVAASRHLRPPPVPAAPAGVRATDWCPARSTVLLAATGTPTVAPLLQATRTIPIVFAIVIDPVGSGFVASLAQPGGNATNFEYSMSGKWVELLKQIAPHVKRAAVLRDPTAAAGIGQFAAGAPPNTSTAFSKARSRPICRCSRW
jgi:hypothetical protein